MKKGIAIAVVIVGVGVLVRRRLGADGGWEARLAKMPDTSPPKWMFSNISAIRENTEKILAMMESSVAR